MPSFASWERKARLLLLGEVAEDRQVLLFGPCDADDIDLVHQTGPSKIFVVDPPDRFHDPRGEIRVITRAALPQSRESFDVIIAPQLAAELRRDPAYLDTLKALLSPEGYIFTMVANPDGDSLSKASPRSTAVDSLDYEELFAALSDLGEVSVFGQTTIVGSLFYDFESLDEDPDLLLDRSLLPDEEDDPGFLILVAGAEAFHRTDLVIAQQPLSSVLDEVRRPAPIAEARPVVRPAPPPSEPAPAPAAISPDLNELRQLKGRLVTAQSDAREAKKRLGAHLEVSCRLEDTIRILHAQRLEDDAHRIDLQLRLAHERSTGSGLRQHISHSMAVLRQQEGEILNLQAIVAEASLREGRLANEKLEIAKDRIFFQQRLDELNGRNANLERQVTGLVEEHQALSEELDQTKSRHSLGEEAKGTLEAEARDLGEQLAVAQAREAEINAELRELEAAGARAQEEYERSANLLGEELAVRVKEAESAAQELLEQLGYEAEAEKAEALENLERDFRKRMESREGELRVELETQIEEARLASRKREEELTSAIEVAVAEREKTQIERLKGEFQASLEAARAEAAAVIAEGEARAAEQLKGVEESHQAILEETREAASQDRSALEEKIADLSAQLESIQLTAPAPEEVQQLTDEVEALRQTQVKQEEELTSALDRASALETNLQEARCEATDLQAQRDESQRKIEELEDALVEARRSAEDTAAQLDTMPPIPGTAPEEDSHGTDVDPAAQEALDASREEHAKASADLQLERVRAEGLLEELARLKARMEGVAEERDGMAAEVQRLTDALHHARTVPTADPIPTPAPIVGEDTMVDLSLLNDPNLPRTRLPDPLPAASLKNPFEETKPKNDSPTDAVGREIESSLEEIEELITSAVPPPRRP